MIKRENFITIQAWMVTDLGLSGASLIIYAVIYGFSQDDENTYQGTRQYLADWCGCSISGVKKCLRQLQEAGLIEQVHHSRDNHEVFYKAKYPRTQSDLGHKVTEPRAQSNLGLGTKVTEARAQSDRAINDDNIADKLEDNIADKIVVCDAPEKKTTFKKPTLEVVKTFAERHGTAVIDPERFFNYYEANGWKVGKNPMKDWRAAFRMWEAREKKDGAPSGSRARKPEDIPTLNETEPEEMTGVWDGVTMPLSDAQVNLLSSSERQRYFEARMDWIIKEK